MIIYFDAETMTPGHVVYMHSDDYDPASNGAHHVALPRGVGLAIEHLHLTRDADGEVAVQVRRASPIVMPPASIVLGETAHFAKVPLGTAVGVNGVAQGTMDDPAGTLDVKPATSGLYAFAFSKPGWMDAFFDLEVRPAPEPDA